MTEGVDPGSTASQASCNVGSGNEGLLLKVPACMTSSSVKQILFFVSVFVTAAFEQVLTYLLQPRTLLLYYHCCFPSCYSITGGDVIGVMMGGGVMLE